MSFKPGEPVRLTVLPNMQAGGAQATSVYQAIVNGGKGI
jgi:hypothetical protein